MSLRVSTPGERLGSDLMSAGPRSASYMTKATSEFLQGFVDERGLNGVTVLVVVDPSGKVLPGGVALV